MLIGLVGQAYSGKDSVADHLVAQHKFTKVSFATPLKEIVARLFDMTEAQLWGSEKNVIDPRYGVTPRDVLQHVGTEGIRALYPNCWVDYLLRNLPAGNVVVADVRFLNEADGILGAGGVLWKTVCPDHPKNAKMTKKQKMHASETELSKISARTIHKAFIVPYGHLPELYAFADAALQEIS